MDNNNNKEKVLPRGYMIPNVSNKEDYAYFKDRIFATIPENTVLICKNKFTGKYYTLSSGFQCISPWVQSKYISLASKSIEYGKDIYKTKDGIEVTIDLALNIRICDPIKYEINCQTPLTELNILMKELLRILVAKSTVEDIYLADINYKNIDPENKINEYTKRTGISVDKIYVKKVELPETMKAEFERKRRAEAAAKANEIEGKAKAQIEAEKIEVLIKALLNMGFSNEQIMEYLSKTIFAKDGVNVIANLGGNKIDSDNLSTFQAMLQSVKNNGQIECSEENLQDKNLTRTKKRK